MRIVTIVAAAVLSAALAVPALAHGFKVGTIEIEHPWARASAVSTPNGAAYLVLRNEGTELDRLISASSAVAARVELHTHIDDNGVMKMRQINAIEIAPDASVKLAPGGLHIMLLELKDQLVKGKAFPLTLTFEKAGTITVDVAVQGAGDMLPEHEGMHHEHGDHDHGDHDHNSH